MTKKPSLNDVGNILNSASTINENNNKIEESFDNTLSRDGSTPNQMNADLDMNSNDVLNVKEMMVNTINANLLRIDGDIVLPEGSVPNWRSTWATTTEYKATDLVGESNSVYICLVDHTASSSFANDLSNGLWELVITDNSSQEAADAAAASAAAAAASAASFTLDGLGISTSNTANDNDTAIAALTIGGRVLDLEGKRIPVNSVPENVVARNGYWRVVNDAGGLDIDYPTVGTRDATRLRVDGGTTVLAWTQGKQYSYSGTTHVSYMAAPGHNPGNINWSRFRLVGDGTHATGFETNNNFNVNNADVKYDTFSAGVVSSTNTDGFTTEFVISKMQNSSGFVELWRRDAAMHNQNTTNNGEDLGEWLPVTVDGVTLGSAIRAAVDTQYSVTTSGVPTLVHGFAQNGIDTSKDFGNFWTGFHGLTGATGPHIIYIDGTPKDGAGSISYVARVGLLTEGVEPTVAYYTSDTGLSRLCGFIRSQSASYPIRFWSTSGVSQAAVEGAGIQDAPVNDFANLSPICCKMRPRSMTDGGLITDSTLAGDGTDELWFVFTDTRTRDSTPGAVALYVGKCAVSDFDDFWGNAEIEFLTNLYYADSNDTESTNQVGVADLSWHNPNTLVVTTSTETPRVTTDLDESHLECFTIKLRDSYADAPLKFDDGTNVPTHTVKAPEYRPHFPESTSIGPRVNYQIEAGEVKYAGTFMVLEPQSGTTDTLDRIAGGIRDGDLVVLRTNSSANEITVAEGGNLSVAGSFVMNNARDTITLMYDSASGVWIELSRSNNGV